MSKFSNNIKTLRNNQGKTQEQAAKLLGIERSTLNGYEQGTIKNPKLRAITKFADFYNVTIDDLITKEIPKVEHGKRIPIRGGYVELRKGSTKTAEDVLKNHNQPKSVGIGKPKMPEEQLKQNLKNRLEKKLGRTVLI